MASRYYAGQKAVMTIRLDDDKSFDVVIKRLNARIKIVKSLDRMVEDIAQDLNRQYLQPLIRDLSEYPPRKLGMPIRWTSDRQRRKVMAILRAQMEERGDDELWYHRTGEYGYSWQAQIVINPHEKGVVRIRVFNTAVREGAGGRKGISQFIQGRIGMGVSRRSIQRYRKPIQPFHLDRGWKPAAPQVQATFKQMRQHALASYRNRYEILLSQV